MTPINKTSKIFFCVVGPAIVVLLLLWMRSPVMIHLRAGPMRGDEKLVVFGPLRDRSPEVIASQFLGGIRDAKCMELLASAGAVDVEADCAKEASDPLRTWKLIDRRDELGASQLIFKYASSKAALSEGQWLEMTVQGNHGSWRVTMYGRVY